MIEVKELTKVYREGRGIKNISFQVDPGTAFGFLGPNGAGKTTTIRLLMGFLKPDSGRVTINDCDCWAEKTEVKKIVSYLPGELHFMETLTGVEFLNLMAISTGIILYEGLLTWVYPVIAKNPAIAEIAQSIPSAVKTVFGVPENARTDTFEAFISGQFFARIWVMLMALYGIETANALLQNGG